MEILWIILTKKFEKENHTMLLPINSFKKWKYVLDTYQKFVFVSPHLDDAILSCGNLIYELKKRNKKIVIVTIFTKSSKTLSPQAAEFLKICKYSSASKLFKDRRKEDVRICNYLGVDYKHLGFIDAAWRNIKGKPIYNNSNEQFSGIFSLKDKNIIHEIREKLNQIIFSSNNTIILGPLGIGGHADHVIVNNILSSLKKPKLYWDDYPYKLNNKIWRKYFNSNKIYSLKFKLYNINFSVKQKLINMYASQAQSVLPKKLSLLRLERYYFMKKFR